MVIKKVEKCKCNWGAGLLGLILMTAGFYSLIMGFLTQISSATGAFFLNWWAALYYLVGFLLFGLGKMSKHAACSGCMTHSQYH